MRSVITKGQLDRALALRDMSDPASGPHAMQLVAGAISETLERAWGAPVLVHRASPIVTIHANYEVLGYPAGAPAREARYTRYVDDRRLLRTHMTAVVPEAIRRVAQPGGADDVVVACPGLVYRRDVVDRVHVGEPHQLDLWRVRRGAPLTARDLDAMVGLVVSAILPGAPHRALPASHPYTTEGREVEVETATAGWSCSSAAWPARTSSRRAGSTPGGGRGWPWGSASIARSCCGRASPTSACSARPIRGSPGRCSTSSPTVR